LSTFIPFNETLLKKLAGLQSLPSTERLERSNLDSLELWRLRVDLIWCYKIIFGLVCLDINEFFVLNTNSRSRGHAFKLFKARCSGIRATFFWERVINPWNNLPSNTDFSSLPAFKRFIMAALRSRCGHYIFPCGFFYLLFFLT